MRVAYGADESTPVTRAVAAWLEAEGHQVVTLVEDAPWPEVGAGVAAAVTAGEADLGVVWCYTGTGVAMAANKVPGARAALCVDAATADGARRWNDANVLALSQRLTTEETATEMVRAFLAGVPDPDELATIATVEPETASSAAIPHPTPSSAHDGGAAPSPGDA
ncbi:MAG: RpiB/LacA/LacB family sugar-phosphate isomerase [Microthrixaceae bacterium]